MRKSSSAKSPVLANSVPEFQHSRQVYFTKTANFLFPELQVARARAQFNAVKGKFLEALLNQDSISEIDVEDLLERFIEKYYRHETTSHSEKEFDSAFQAYNDNGLLRDPFWLKQFSFKKAQHDFILESYNLVDAKTLKHDCFPGWGATDPEAALCKRAERKQLLSIVEQGNWLFPIEQFDVNADTPKLTSSFTEILKAYAENGEITSSEMLYWLCMRQPLPMPNDSVIGVSIEQSDIQDAWERLRSEGPSTPVNIRPLDCLLDGDKDTAIRLFYDWTNIEQDGPAKPREEVIDALKQWMAIERISISDLMEG